MVCSILKNYMDCTMNSVSCSKYLMLRFLELGEGHHELRVEVLVAEELERALVDGARARNASALLLEARVLDPVLHLGMHLDVCTQR